MLVQVDFGWQLSRDCKHSLMSVLTKNKFSSLTFSDSGRVFSFFMSVSGITQKLSIILVRRFVGLICRPSI